MHAVPIPYLGGLAMLGGMVAAYVVARELPFLSRSGPFVFRDAGVVLIAGALICAVGVLDDLFELDALTKLGGQVLAAGFLIAFGIQYVFFPGSDGIQFSLQPAQGALLTGFVVVATVNAVNFVDGLDGLAAGVVGIGALASSSSATSWPTSTTSTLATTGGAAERGRSPGRHRLPATQLPPGPALHGRQRLDADRPGALGQRGHAHRAVRRRPISEGGAGSRPASLPTLLPLLLPVSILIVPMLDLVLAVVRRTRAGRSPFAPDKQHLHHRLLEIGHSHRRAVLIMYLWAALVAFGTVLVSLYGDETWTWVARGGDGHRHHRADLRAPELHHPAEPPLPARAARRPPATAAGDSESSYRARGRCVQPRRTLVLLFTSTSQRCGKTRDRLPRTAADDDDRDARDHPGGAPRVLLGAACAALVAGLLLVLLAALVSGSAAAYGAAAGTAIVIGVFAIGSVAVDLVAGLLPNASLMVAMLTYTLQVVALALIFVALSGSGLLDDTIDGRWLGGTVIVGTFAWLVVQIVADDAPEVPADRHHQPHERSPGPGG